MHTSSTVRRRARKAIIAALTGTALGAALIAMPAHAADVVADNTSQSITNQTVDNVTATNDGYIEANTVTINGNVTASNDGEVDIYDNSVVKGNLSATSGGEIWTGTTTITGNGIADGHQSEVHIHDNSLVNGNLTATNRGYVHIYDSTVKGNLAATNRGYIYVDSSTIDGNLSATNRGDLEIEDSEITGNLTVDGRHSDAEIYSTDIQGDAIATNGGSISAYDQSSITGDAIADGAGSSISLSGNTDVFGDTIARNGGYISVTEVLLSLQKNAISDGAGSQFDLNGSHVIGDAIAKNGGWLDAYLGSNIEGNAIVEGKDSWLGIYSSTVDSDATASGGSTLYLGHDWTQLNPIINGDVTINDNSILATGASGGNTGDFYLNDNGGTTAFNNSSIFAPDLNDGIVYVDNLTISNDARITPWFGEDLGGIPNHLAVGTSYNVLDYQTSDGKIFNVYSPLDWEVNDNGNVISVTLASNNYDIGGITRNKNENALTPIINGYVNNSQTDDGEFNIQDIPGGWHNPIHRWAIRNSLETPYLQDEIFFDNLDAIHQDLTSLTTFGEAFSHQNAQAYWGARSFLNSINANINNNADTTGSTPQTFALNDGSNTKSTFAQLASLERAMTPSFQQLNASSSTDPYANKQGIWAAYNGVRQHTEADSGIGSHAWRSSTDGFTVGYTSAGSSFSWGVAGGHQRSRMNFSDINSNGKQDGNNLGAYGSWHRNNLYLTGILGYGRYDNDTYHYSQFGDASSKIKTLSGSLELGKHFRRGNSDFTPYASLAWTRINQDDFRIHNGGSGIHLNNTNNSVFTTELGARYNRRMIDSDGTLKGGWQAGLAWLHQGNDTDLAASLGFNGIAGAAPIQGTPLEGNSLVASIGAYGRIHNRLIGYAGYRGVFGSDQKVHGINAGLGYKF